MEALIELLNSFEEGVAKGTTRNRTQIVGGLRSIENAAVTLSNRGGLPPGTKSICLRIKQLAGDIRTGIESRELSASEFREIVRTKLGQLSTALKRNIQGKLHASDKEQVRQHEAARILPKKLMPSFKNMGTAKALFVVKTNIMPNT